MTQEMLFAECANVSRTTASSSPASECGMNRQEIRALCRRAEGLRELLKEVALE